jgi:hypothetical protein
LTNPFGLKILSCSKTELVTNDVGLLYTTTPHRLNRILLVFQNTMSKSIKHGNKVVAFSKKIGIPASRSLH